jgi:DNA invertase Pin-like site-specific DNA recombinase
MVHDDDATHSTPLNVATQTGRFAHWVILAPAIGQLSNRGLSIMIEELLTSDNATAPARIASNCHCDRGQPVATGRRFVNQKHYDRSRTLHRDRAQKLVDRCRQGVSKRQLAKEFGISYSAVRRLLEKRLQ